MPEEHKNLKKTPRGITVRGGDLGGKVMQEIVYTWEGKYGMPFSARTGQGYRYEKVSVRHKDSGNSIPGYLITNIKEGLDTHHATDDDEEFREVIEGYDHQGMIDYCKGMIGKKE